MTPTLATVATWTVVVCASLYALAFVAALVTEIILAIVHDWQTFRRLQRSRGAFSLRRLKGGRR